MGRPRLYPWQRWFSPKRVRFTAAKGRDFTCSIQSMIWKIRNQASKSGVSIRTKVLAGAISVTIRRKLKGK